MYASGQGATRIDARVPTQATKAHWQIVQRLLDTANELRGCGAGRERFVQRPSLRPLCAQPLGSEVRIGLERRMKGIPDG